MRETPGLKDMETCLWKGLKMFSHCILLLILACELLMQSAGFGNEKPDMASCLINQAKARTVMTTEDDALNPTGNASVLKLAEKAAQLHG
ncbi:MAG: hypothetical protein AB1757_13130 [Acidobacteriota bacterium]